MALLFLDSFDHYTTGQVDRKYLVGSGTIVAGRHGNGRTLTGCRLAPNPGSTRCVIGGAYKFTDTFNVLYYISDVDNHTTTVQTTNDGGIEVFLYYRTLPAHTVRSAADVWRVNQ